MSTQACVPCAKRKVRCDRADPSCSNCKRRKQDKCVYPELSPNDRIKRLEALVRSLGGDPEDDPQTAKERLEAASASVQTNSGARPDGGWIWYGSIKNAKDGLKPYLTGEGEGKTYVESGNWGAWRGWHSKGFAHLSQASSVIAEVGNPIQTTTTSSVLRSIVLSDASLDLALSHPSPQDADILWDTYVSNVQPILKLSFEWEAEQYRARAIEPGPRKDFSNPEHAFVFAAYQISVFSMKKEDCSRMFNKDKTALIRHYQVLFEQALARSNFLNTTDVTLVQAAGLYMASGVDRLDTASLFTMMGATIRIAERLGLHRDGTHLDLTPTETERRRRIWWELQHIDLGLAVRCGLTPLTLMANWDTRMPLNINDDDIKPGTTEFPAEHKGLTTNSALLWVMTIIETQRSYFKSGVGLSWAADRSSPEDFKLAFVDKIEEDLNTKFIQYCDPVIPIHSFIQLAARATMCGLRRLIYHPVADGKKGERNHPQLLNQCIRCLEYDVAFHSNRGLDSFNWFIRGFFPWGALISVVLETTRAHTDRGKAKSLWDLVSRVYTHNHNLTDLDFEDPRRLHAAELTLTAWKTYSNRLASQADVNVEPVRPIILADLEKRIAEYYAQLPENVRNVEQDASRQPRTAIFTKEAASDNAAFDSLWREDGPLAEGQMDDLSTLDLDQIDWSFWNTFNGSNYDAPTWPGTYQG